MSSWRTWMLLAALVAAGPLNAAGLPEQTVERYILRLGPDAAGPEARARLGEQLAASGVRLRRALAHLPYLLIEGRDVPARLAGLRGMGELYRDRRRQRRLQESLPLIGQPTVQASGADGAGVAVAVVDSGLDYTLPAFGSCTAVGEPAGCRVVYSADVADDDGALDDTQRHGTHVSAIVAGVAPGADIIALDVFGPLSAWDSDILTALDWVLANRERYNIGAVNLSLGGQTFTDSCPWSVYTDAFAQLRAEGVVPVAASGNSGSKTTLDEPACAPGAVSVGAVYDESLGRRRYLECTDAQTAADQVTCYSNSSETLTLLAPGDAITAAGMSMGGTSQATPHVSGAVAVLRGLYPNESVGEIVARLTDNGVTITDPANGVRTPRVDLLAAVSANEPAAGAPDYVPNWDQGRGGCFAFFARHWCLAGATVRVVNQGDGAAAEPGNLSLYLSADGVFDAGDRRLKAVSVSALAAGADELLTLWALTRDVQTLSGSYLVAVVAVAGDSDSNNDVAVYGPLP